VTRRASARRRLGEAVGVPALPPSGVTTVFTRVRAAVRRTHLAMAPPPVRILEGLFGVLDHRVLVALCAAGVPEALTGPTTLATLAERVGADAPMLERLVRYGHTRGWVRIDRRGRVRPTRVTRFLDPGHPGGWRAWVDFAGGPDVFAAVGALTAGPIPVDGFAAVNGRPFFEWMAEHPERGRAFDGAMEAGARMHGHVLAAALDWSGVATVCDVGGGTGMLLATVLDLVPGLTGTVLDLPTVVARAAPHPRLTAQGGDAFAAVPDGFDAYLLVNVLHDWNDVDASRLLRSVAAAAGGALVVVVDHERHRVPRDELVASVDVLMASLTNGGRERSTAEFVAIAAGAGLGHERSLTLASGDRAHLFRSTPRRG